MENNRSVVELGVSVSSVEIFDEENDSKFIS